MLFVKLYKNKSVAANDIYADDERIYGKGAEYKMVFFFANENCLSILFTHIY